MNSRARARTLGFGILVIAMFIATGLGHAEDLTWEAPKSPTNAALVYYRSFLLLTPLSDDARADKAFSELIETGAYNAAALDPYIERNMAALTMLEAASRIETCDFGVQFDQGASAQLPELARARDLGRLGIVAVRQAVAEDNAERAVDLLAAVLALARGCHQEGTAIGTLVAAAIVDMANVQVGHVLAAPSAPALERMDAALEAVTPVLSDWSAAIEGEMKMNAFYFPPPGTVLTRTELGRFRDVAAASSTEDSGAPTADAIGHVADGTASPEELEAAAQFFSCTPEDLATPEKISALLTARGMALMQTLRDMQAALAMPYPEGQARMESIMTAAENADAMVQVLVPALGALVFQKAKMETRLGMMRAAVAVLRFGEAQGQLPETLSELPAGVPTDPFTNGEPFTYRLAEEGDGFSLVGKGTEKRQASKPLELSVAWGRPQAESARKASPHAR